MDIRLLYAKLYTGSHEFSKDIAQFSYWYGNCNAVARSLTGPRLVFPKPTKNILNNNIWISVPYQ
jgi:hypothetical protein